MENEELHTVYVCVLLDLFAAPPPPPTLPPPHTCGFDLFPNTTHVESTQYRFFIDRSRNLFSNVQVSVDVLQCAVPLSPRRRS
jgi:hypothetical protein